MNTSSKFSLGKILLCLSLSVVLSGCKEILYSGLTERDANEMIAVLSLAGIEAGKQTEKGDLYALQTEKKHFAQAIGVLKDYGYPKQQYESMGEVFKKEGLISSPLEERVRFIYALSQNVAETLTQIDGVVAARVHIVLPENNPFDEKIQPSSASVFIKHHPNIDLSHSKSDIKLIVEKSIEGLTYDKVTVVMLPAKSVSAMPPPVVEAGSSALWWWLPVVALLLAVGAFVYKMIQAPPPVEESRPKARPVGSPTMQKTDAGDAIEGETPGVVNV